MGQHDTQGATVLEGDALGELARRAQVVEVVRDQPRMPADLILAALLAVDLLDDRERDHDLVVLEGEDRVGIVQQNVGVEDVDLLQILSLKLAPFLAPARSRIPPGTPTAEAPRSLSSGSRRSADDPSGCHPDSVPATGTARRRSSRPPRPGETSAAGRGRAASL